MTIQLIGNYGRNKEGVTTFRINGDKEDLYTIIDEARKMGFKFWDTPNILKSYKTWTVVLKLYVPKELGYPDESI